MHKQMIAEPRRFGAALLAELLTSCGGAGGDQVDVPLNTVRLACDVTDTATGAAVADATVNNQAGSTEYKTQTNANGSCVLNLPATEAAGVAFPVAGKASATEAEPYRTMLVSVAEQASNASREGGFLGFGGVRVSDKERAFISEFKAAVAPALPNQ